MEFQEVIHDCDIEKALHKLQWHRPTLVQEQVLPLLCQGKNVVVQAKTGSGKTGAYLLPALNEISWEENKPQCLILSPTRELALQIQAETQLLGKYKRMKCVALIGKVPMAFQIQDLKQKTHVVTGTLGRVLEHLVQGSLCVDHITHVVFDEVDEMCRMGFLDTIHQIMEFLPPKAVYCMCSATLNEAVTHLCERYVSDYEYVQIASISMPEQLIIDAYEVEPSEKDDFLWKLLLKEACDSAIVFCNTRTTCEHVYHMLSTHMKEVTCLHGAMEQEERIKALTCFRYGEAQILVASDIAARGLDMEQVQTIIHYELPLEKERFVHRSGRSGRMENQGHVISLFSKKETAQKKAIESYCQRKMQVLDGNQIRTCLVNEETVQHFLDQRKIKQHKEEVFHDDVLRLYIHGGKQKKISAKDIVGAICQIDGIQGNDIGVIEIQDYGSYVEILHGKGAYVFDKLQSMTIKKRKLKVAISHHQ